jgi:hypothetical protein
MGACDASVGKALEEAQHGPESGSLGQGSAERNLSSASGSQRLDSLDTSHVGARHDHTNRCALEEVRQSSSLSLPAVTQRAQMVVGIVPTDSGIGVADDVQLRLRPSHGCILRDARREFVTQFM